jgi:hypothetical protein
MFVSIYINCDFMVSDQISNYLYLKEALADKPDLYKKLVSLETDHITGCLNPLGYAVKQEDKKKNPEAYKDKLIVLYDGDYLHEMNATPGLGYKGVDEILAGYGKAIRNTFKRKDCSKGRVCDEIYRGVVDYRVGGELSDFLANDYKKIKNNNDDLHITRVNGSKGDEYAVDVYNTPIKDVIKLVEKSIENIEKEFDDPVYSYHTIDDFVKPTISVGVGYTFEQANEALMKAKDIKDDYLDQNRKSKYVLYDSIDDVLK